MEEGIRAQIGIDDKTPLVLEEPKPIVPGHPSPHELYATTTTATVLLGPFSRFLVAVVLTCFGVG